MILRKLFWKGKVNPKYYACNDMNIYTTKLDPLPYTENENGLKIVKIDGEDIPLEIAVIGTLNRERT